MSLPRRSEVGERILDSGGALFFLPDLQDADTMLADKGMANGRREPAGYRLPLAGHSPFLVSLS